MNFIGNKAHGTKRLGLLILAVFVCGIAVVQAQTGAGNAAMQQARLFNDRSTSGALASGEQLFRPLDNGTGSGDSAADADVGEQWLLKRNLPPNPFAVRGSFSILYTDNVALSRRGTLADAFAVADFGIGYTRPLAPDWTFSINLGQSFFRYHRYHEFDFESSNANVALSHPFPQFANVLVSLQYSLSWLTGGSIDDQIYFGHTFSLGATKVIQINPANVVDLNGSVGYTFADPSDLQRAEIRAALSYTVQISRRFSATAAARLEFYDYTNDDREDLLQSIALGARWDLNEWMFVSASISVANNLSSQPVYRYRAINTGATVAAHIRF